MDAFFAALEQLRRPGLRGRPVVVGGADPGRRGVVATASYEARAFGIHSAMPLRTAHQRCPHAVFLPPDFRLYVRVSRRIKDILRAFSPVLESGGLDEAYLDLSEVEGASARIAAAIQERVRSDTGLTCSIGIAPTKLLAKIASDMKKPAGVMILEPGDVPARVWPLPARRLIGVGPKTQERLERLGIATIGDIAGRPLEFLVRHFGEAHARYLHEAANGRRDTPLVTARELKSISRETTFQEDVGDHDALIEVLERITTPVVDDLRRHGRRARTVSVKLRYADFETRSRQATLPWPTDAHDEIRAAVLRCFERFDLSRPVRLVGVGVKGLDPPARTGEETGQVELDLPE